ncbi:MAG: histidine kinase [Actinomycetota bacterium]|nr:histidine kinase [Actinomycetota bacterium]
MRERLTSAWRSRWFDLAVMAWRRHAVVAGGAFGALVLILALVGGLAQSPGVLLLPLFVLAYAIGAFEAKRVAVIGLVVMVAPFTAGVVVVGGAWLPVLFAAAPWGVGRGMRSQREIAAALEQRTRELEAEQDAYAQLAVRHERARIARELHDVVSHNLAVVVVQAGAGRVAPPAAQHRAAGRFSSIRTAGEHGLEELSRLARMLDARSATERDDGRQLRLHALVEQATAAGLTVQTDAPLDDLRLPGDVAHTAYRIVQEALTNAIKHAPGATLTVRVELCKGVLEIDVCDDGVHHAISQLDASGSGFGLPGMHARVADLRGELRAGKQPGGGWRVWARLPVSSGRA